MTQSLIDVDVDFGALRPMTQADLAQVLAWRNHPDIRANMYTQHEISMDEHRAWWERMHAAPSFRALIYENEGQPTGYVAFSDINGETGTASWAFYARPDAPRGNGSFMEFLALDHAFGVLGLRKLNCEVIGTNARVVRMHEKFGFQREGLFKAHVMIGNALDDVHRLALFADDWQAARTEKLATLTALRKRALS